MRNPYRRVVLTVTLGLAGAAFSCGGGGGGGGLPAFRVVGVSVAQGSIQRINRSIEVEFSEPVDFTTVSLNTIRIASSGGVPVAGAFTLLDPRTVSFQPLCPTKPDFSDAGFRPGGLQYELSVAAASPGNPLSVRGQDGGSLLFSETRKFFTPDSSDPTELFYDERPGPPAPVVRETGSSDLRACYVELGGDSSRRHYFERDPVTGVVSIQPPTALPLNLYSAGDTRVAFVVVLDQPILPSLANIGPATARLEYRDASGGWRALQTSVELEANCTVTGSRLRLEPRGLLPADTLIRAVITTQLEDLIGETNLVPQDSFALVAADASPAAFADEYLEEFRGGGTAAGSTEDLLAVFPEPRAEWGADRLGAAFSFPGTGGPSGTFDWRVPTVDVEVVNTSFDTIRGGPDFVPQFDLPVVGGVIDVRNLEIPAGAVVRGIGPNPLVIYASGTVRIEGLLDVSGNGNLGANTVGTAAMPEAGSPGQCGGGDGGDSSPQTTTSSPRGSPGYGPFQQPGAGGGPGESGWGASAPQYRPGGGGGGRFGPDQRTNGGAEFFDQTLLGLDAEMGFDGHDPGNTPGENGALDGSQMGHYDAVGAQGGLRGGTPFSDSDATNDFFGRRYDAATGIIKQGELLELSAGSGGGGAGDGVQCGAGCVFPPVPFNQGTNMKGGAAGGGGGSVLIVALGDVVFAGSGQIRARGGFGGHGVLGGGGFIAAGGGGGSGGHVIVQTAGRLDFSGLTSGKFAILATGGQGGSGIGNSGGATTIGERPNFDACYEATPVNCIGFRIGAGGDGGPGLVQLHTESGLADILMPPGAMLSQLTQPRPIGPLIPQVGKRSRAQSTWIPLGQGGFQVGTGTFTSPAFSFGGTDPFTGRVLTTAGLVDPVAPPALGPDLVQVAPAVPFIDPLDGRVLVSSAAGLSAAQLANPSLLKRFTLRLRETGNASNRQDFTIVAAALDSAAGVVRLSVSADGPSLSSFVVPGTLTSEVLTTFFGVETDGVRDRLPDSASIQVLFQATTATSQGLPQEPPALAFTPDAAALNTGTDHRFLRFQVLFDVDTLGQGLTLDSAQPALRFLRLPFAY